MLYRARYAGLQSEYSTIYNFFRSLRSIINQFNPDSVFFVVEGVPKKRKELLPEYKANRVYDDGLFSFNVQRNYCISFIKQYLPIQVVKHKDYECDDIINYIASKNIENEITIISTDTDFIQTISEKIKLYNPVKKSFVNSFEVDYILFKALKGDPTDNIKGFKGIGEKTAKKLAASQELLNIFLDSQEKIQKLNENIELIKFHKLEDEDIKNIDFYKIPEKSCWDIVKKEFSDMSFTSMIDDKYWYNFTKTFDKLFMEKQNELLAR